MKILYLRRLRGKACTAIIASPACYWVSAAADIRLHDVIDKCVKFLAFRPKDRNLQTALFSAVSLVNRMAQ